MRGISWLAGKLSASQEGLSKEWVSQENEFGSGRKVLITHCHLLSAGGLYPEGGGNMSSETLVSIYKAKRRHIPEAVMWMKFDKCLVSTEMWLNTLYPQKQLHVTCRWRRKTVQVTYWDSWHPRKFSRHRRSIPNGQKADCELGSCWPRNRTPGMSDLAFLTANLSGLVGFLQVAFILQPHRQSLRANLLRCEYKKLI